MKEIVIQPSTAKQNITKLPDWCFGVLLLDKSIIKIKAGEMGYYIPANKITVPLDKTPDQVCDALNEYEGVTRGQREAMQSGSMFGWEIPATNPENYNADGTFKTKEFPVA